MVSCEEVLAQFSSYLDDEVSPALRTEIEEHLKGCHRCSILVSTTRKMLYVVGDERVFEIPLGYSERLHRRIDQMLESLA
jgi:anti-sigma factor RsiW